MKNMVRSVLLLICFWACAVQSYAQINPTLSIQGILKKSNGVAVNDGAYNMTFRLYTVATGDTAIWTEIQPEVEVSSGIYSATLGIVTPLNIPFNQLYYLGITVGSTELTPRNPLTTAPYALSLLGLSNQFPSAGAVKADSMVVQGGVLARGGAPGLNGVDKNGYAFSGNNGDKDSGLFSTADGKVALYANNTEVLTTTPAKVQTTTNLGVTGSLSANNLSLPKTGSVSHNGNNGWRLVEIDDFENGAEGWEVYNKMMGQSIGWNNPMSSGPSNTSNWGGFAGKALLPGNTDFVLKKNFNLSAAGSFTQIKVKFRYYYIDSWDHSQDRAWAAFATTVTGGGIRVGWEEHPSYLADSGNGDLNNQAFKAISDFQGSGNYTDHWNSGEMTAKATGSSFWVFFGASVNEQNANETYAIGAVEIYVR